MQHKLDSKLREADFLPTPLFFVGGVTDSGQQAAHGKKRSQEAC